MEEKMMKESVIIVFAGRVLAGNLAAIKEKYQIVAIADNRKRGKLVGGYQCIGIEEIEAYHYDTIIICSVKYEQVIRAQLSSEGIADSKIYSIGSLDRQLYYDKDRKKYSRDKKDYIEACRRKQVHQFLYQEKDEFPILSDYRETAGNVDGHYFLMDILMAREVAERRPGKHFDIGSRIDGFISHLLAAGINTTVIESKTLKKNRCGDFVIGRYYL